MKHNHPQNLSGQFDTPTCPNFGEPYRPSDKLGFRGDITERHPVSTSDKIELRDGQPVLILKAHCPCGWSATNVVGADTDSQPGEK